MGIVSYRKYIQWHPDEASEPTSTVVLTSPENRFVDLRILLPPDGSDKLSQDPTGQLPLDRLDWAIAGTTSSEAATAPTGEAIRRATFRHWVSSRDADPRGVSDVGDMYPQHGSSTTLERGVMVNPATGRPAPYDELWADLLAPTSDPIAVLRVDDGEGGVRGMVIRIGTLCQALVRDARGVSLERWEKSEASVGEEDEDEDEDEVVVVEGTWTRTVRMGERELPCEDVLTGKVVLEKDGVVTCQGDVWEVVELSW